MVVKCDLLLEQFKLHLREKGKETIGGEKEMSYRETWQICQSQFNCELRYVLQQKDEPMCDHHLNDTHICQHQYCPLATEEKKCEC